MSTQYKKTSYDKDAYVAPIKRDTQDSANWRNFNVHMRYRRPPPKKSMIGQPCGQEHGTNPIALLLEVVKGRKTHQEEGSPRDPAEPSCIRWVPACTIQGVQFASDQGQGGRHQAGEAEGH